MKINLAKDQSMPTRALAIAGMAALLSAALFIYSQWLWIIQTNGDAYAHWSGVMALVAVGSLVVGMMRRR
jgi:predicted ABC-type exoprotein transport system permease subunit